MTAFYHVKCKIWMKLYDQINTSADGDDDDGDDDAPVAVDEEC
jgi:hypothetical protein